MDLRETIDWLLNVENLAGAFYRKVAEAFEEDEEWSKFFRHLSTEERWHAEVITRAFGYLELHGAQLPISVDEETKEGIMTPFIRGSELLAAGSFNKENIIDWLARAEFSEWNDIFIYVVKSLGQEKKFMPVVARIDGHLREIEQFMGSSPEGRKHLHIIRSLPRLRKEHILIVNGDVAVLEFLKKLLEHEGRVETARNGREGLRLLKEKYFDVIIADIEMPVIDGIGFYRKAVSIDAEVGKRIVFFSDLSRSEHIDFIRENKLNHLARPAPIREIVKRVSDVLHKADMD